MSATLFVAFHTQNKSSNKPFWSKK